MSALMIARVQVSDLEEYKKYVAAASKATEKFGGKYIVRGGAVTPLENYDSDDRVVVMEFPDSATAKAWYESAEYQAAREFRKDIAVGKFFIVEGC